MIGPSCMNYVRFSICLLVAPSGCKLCGNGLVIQTNGERSNGQGPFRDWDWVNERLIEITLSN